MTSLKILGRIVKVLPKKFNVDLQLFEVSTVDDEILLCSYDKFLPILEGDAISAVGVQSEGGPKKFRIAITIIEPPYVNVGNDDDSALEHCRMALRRSPNFYSIINEVRKTASKDETLTDCLNHLSVALKSYGHSILRGMFRGKDLTLEIGKLLKWWYNNRVLRRLYLLGLTKTEIKGSYQDEVELYKICLSNPYRISSISLEKAESILHQIGKPPSAEDKYCGQILRKVVQCLRQEKQSYVSITALKTIFSELDKYEAKLAREYDLVVHQDYVAINRIERMEKDVASFLHYMNSQEITEVKISDAYEEQPKDITLIAPAKLTDLSKEQTEAILFALSRPVSIITGAAGTGKTTLLRYLVSILPAGKFILTSFTGKAVARIKEKLAGIEVIPPPATMNYLLGSIKRLLAIGGDNPQYEYLIIDEISMVETSLFAELVKAHTNNYFKHIIMLGDINQLSPIGWGCLMREMLNSQTVPTFTLTENRRSEGKGIVINANRLLEGYFFEEYKDSFELCYSSTPLNLIKRDGLTASEIRVIAPFNETVAQFNKELQDYFCNGASFLIDQKNIKWYKHDRVMMTKNNYNIEVMNGQEGYVVDLNEEEGLIEVCFNNTNYKFSLANYDPTKILLKYPPEIGKYLDIDDITTIPSALTKKYKYINDKYSIVSNDKILFINTLAHISADLNLEADESVAQIPSVDDLVHSYALTVHKSQGSEWDCVIVVLPPRTLKTDFITKNLLYTAITRAKQKVYCIGPREAWLHAALTLEKEPKQHLSDFLINPT